MDSSGLLFWGSNWVSRRVKSKTEWHAQNAPLPHTSWNQTEQASPLVVFSPGKAGYELK